MLNCRKLENSLPLTKRGTIVARIFSYFIISWSFLVIIHKLHKKALRNTAGGLFSLYLDPRTR